MLRPGGQLLILEFFRPTAWWPRAFYATFGRTVFPLAGALLAGDSGAYRYLNRSIAGFLSAGEAGDLLARQGFTAQRWAPLSGGLSHAVAADRP